MKLKTVYILTGILIDSTYICQYFYIYPRYRYRCGTHLYTIINKILNKNYIGDGLKKLKFKRTFINKYKNGLLISNFYAGDYSNFCKKDLTRIKVDYRFYGDISCENCYHQHNQYCLIWKNHIFNYKYKCDEWEQKDETV